MGIKIKHSALYIKEEKYADRFFQDLLGRDRLAEFLISDALSQEIFGVKGIEKGVLYKFDDMLIEVFLGYIHIETPIINHICLEVDDREIILKKAFELGFKHKRVKRENKPDTVFVYDDYKNKYEIKDI